MRYSFLKEFTQGAERAERRFEDVPKKFFRCDMVNGPREGRYAYMMHPISTYICDQLTTVAEGSKGNARQVREMAPELDLIDAQACRIWGGKGGNRLGVVVTMSGDDGQIETVMRLRDFIGYYRTYKATGFNAFNYCPSEWDDYGQPEGLGDRMREELTKALGIVLNYRAQSSYIANSKRKHESTARAWEQKKLQDRDLLHLASVSPLNAYFTHIEIDQSVCATEWQDFEGQVLEALKVLPWSKELAPVLRVRKLGRHKANGIYFPHVNTIAVDVRTSAAFIHEYSHYVDLALNNSFSTTKPFAEIVAKYRAQLELPEALDTVRKRAYYTTPTEIFARASEVYHYYQDSQTRLINNEAIEANRFDYAPLINMRSEIESLFETSGVFEATQQPEPFKVLQPAASLAPITGGTQTALW